MVLFKEKQHWLKQEGRRLIKNNKRSFRKGVDKKIGVTCPGKGIVRGVASGKLEIKSKLNACSFSFYFLEIRRGKGTGRHRFPGGKSCRNLEKGIVQEGVRVAKTSVVKAAI